MHILEKQTPETVTITNVSITDGHAPHDAITLGFWLKRLITTVLVCVLTFMALEGLARVWIVQAKPEISHAKEFDRKFQLAQTLKHQKAPGILILGDSLIDFALYPELLNAKLHSAGYQTEIYNLAVPGNSYEQDLLLLKTAIKAGSKPRLAIVNAHLRLFNAHYYQTQQQNQQHFEQSYLGRCLSGTHSNWQAGFRCQLGKNSYLLRYRNFFKTELNNLPTTVLNPKKRAAYTYSLFPATEFSPRGWTPGYNVYSNAEFQAKFATPKHYKTLANDLSHFQWTDAHFATLSAFCRKEHIPLLVIWPPEHPINAQAYQYFGLPQTQLATKLAHTLNQPGVTYLNLKDSVQDTEAYMDPEHVNPVGATQISAQLAKLLLNDQKALLQEQHGKAVD